MAGVVGRPIQNEFLPGIDRDRRVRIPKLKLNVDDNHLFGNIVASKKGDTPPNPTKDSHHRLLVAYKRARTRVEKIVAVVDEKSHGDFPQ